MIRLRVLGGFALEGPSGAAPPARPPRRGDAVLAVLAVCGDLGCTRERLISLIWSEGDEVRAGQGMRDALYAIRRALHPGAVTSGGRILRLDPAVVGSDVTSFSAALRSGRHADAVREYAGPLLDGFHVDDAPEFEHWVDGERTRLAREFAEALERLATAAERSEAWHEAVGWWGRAAAHDPLNSRVALRHVLALAASGDRANALKVADAHTLRLREELGLEPDREILSTIERIRRGEGPTRLGAVRPPADLLQSQDESPRDQRAEASSGGAATPTLPASTAERVPRPLLWAAAAATVVVAGAVGLGWWPRPPAGETSHPRTSIAVLPFRNLGVDSSHAYFAGGLHDELLTQLSRVASLRVIGRASASGYQETSKPLRQIGNELAVGSIVEASVQVVGNHLRVIAQLVDPNTGAELWAERYDGTMDSAFAVQSDIAQRIVTAVGATLTSTEAGAIASAPTQNALAYDVYLQGMDYWRRPGLVRQNLESALQLFERALALDPAFALAHAAASSASADLYDLRYDRSGARLDEARREADAALRLAPDLPQAHLAVGRARHLERGDFRGALVEFTLAVHGAPNDANLWAWIGRLQRHLGNWDSVLAAFDRARRLDPRDALLFHSIGDTYQYLHRYHQAIEAYRHELELAPDLVQARLSLAWSYVLWKGELDTLRAVLGSLPLDADPGEGGEAVVADRLAALLLERRPDSVLALLRAVPPAARAGAATASRMLIAAQAHELRGDTAAARTADESAMALLDAAERARPGDLGVHAARGMVAARLGRRAEALREARWLEQSREYRADRYSSAPAQDRARILIRAGAFDAALAEIERLLGGPSLLGIGELRLSPDFDPIRNDPRFQQLLVKYASAMPGAGI